MNIFTSHFKEKQGFFKCSSICLCWKWTNNHKEDFTRLALWHLRKQTLKKKQKNKFISFFLFFRKNKTKRKQKARTLVFLFQRGQPFWDFQASRFFAFFLLIVFSKHCHHLSFFSILQVLCLFIFSFPILFVEVFNPQNIFWLHFFFCRTKEQSISFPQAQELNVRRLIWGKIRWESFFFSRSFPLELIYFERTNYCGLLFFLI